MRRLFLSLALLATIGCNEGAAGGAAGHGGTSTGGGGAGGSGGAGVGGIAGAGSAGGEGGVAGSSWAGPGADPAVWQRRTIYLVMPDRFANGDPSNDTAGGADCFDPADPGLFHGGDLEGLGEHIAYLQELGVGTLWVTPLVEQVPIKHNGACGYHGYWADLASPADPIDASVEGHLGTPADVDGLLAGMHGAGIKVLLDVVVNHSGRKARIVSQAPDWFHPAAGCDQLGPAEQYCSLNGLPDFAQEQPEVAAYVTATTTKWLTRYPFDGVRMDTAKHVPLSYFEQSWMPAARAARPFPFVVAEVFDDAPMSRFAPFLDAGFDSFFHFPLRRALVSSIGKGGSLDEVAGVVNDTLDTLGPERARMVSLFLDNHDVPRFMQEAGDLSDAERVRRYRLALVALFTLPGIPQLYYGDELGALGDGSDNRRDMPAWAFDPSQRAGAKPGYFGDPAETFSLTRSLVELRNEHPALWQGYFCEMWRPNGGTNLYSYYRAAAGDRVLVVIDNGTGASGDIDLKFSTKAGITLEDRAAWPDGIELHDVLGLGAPSTLTVADGKIKVDMPSKTAGVYVATP